MPRSTHRVLWATLIVGLLASSVRASEGDELRLKAHRTAEEAAAQAEKGNHDQAVKLKRQANELFEKAEQLSRRSEGDQQKVAMLKDRLNDLQAQQKHLAESNAPAEARAANEREIDEVKTTLARLLNFVPEQKRELTKFEQQMVRIHRLRIAAENLKAADAPDLAEEARKRADFIEHEVAENKKRLSEEASRGRIKEANPEIRELREEVLQLRQQLQELKQLIQQKP